MSRLRVRVPEPSFAGLRAELGVVEAFPPEVLAEVQGLRPALPEHDATALPLLTVDPEGSRDLDQAVHLEREGDGYRVRYAIADVGAFVAVGSALDAEARRRGQTLYAPDVRVPLHPPALSEGAASLLPGQVRPAALWDLHLDARGEPREVGVARALVRSTRQLTYAGVQAALDGGTDDPQLLLLREVGRLRQERGAERGAVRLPALEQAVEQHGDGPPVLTARAPLPVEGWNAEVSLLTGAVAARLMLDGGVGLLRTMPPFDPAGVTALRRSALALGVAWPEGAGYGEVVSRLDPYEPAHAALLVLATRLLRGAGYTALDTSLDPSDGTAADPALTTHSAVGGPYAHVTAPLRRLVDRFATEVCLALAAGRPVPDGVRAALPELPALMAASDRRAGELERAAVDLAEAVVLAPRVGERFRAAVVESGPKRSTVQLREPAVRARCETPDLPLGEEVDVVLVRADPAARAVVFARA